MSAQPESAVAPPAASLMVTDPTGNSERLPLEPLPFEIGRQPESHLILRDSRVSRAHARILWVNGEYLIEDRGSRHGTFVNGRRIASQGLRNSDRIEFGAKDSYQVTFSLEAYELKRLLTQVEAAVPAPAGVGGNLAKLRAILDLARTLQGAFSIDEVLVSVVDTALAITGAERGFLLLMSEDQLEIKVARHSRGQHLRESDLRVPRGVIRRALQNRRELLSMNFDPSTATGEIPQGSIVDLELRSVICVPLVRIRAGQGDLTNVSAGNETVGVLYMDSREIAADLAGGNRELLQTLAIEASTVMENARLLQEEAGKRQLEEELRLARTIQQSLLPGALPTDGWLRASGTSIASYQVGGDYYDVAKISPSCWSAVLADVSGKGVSSALLASLLQGALLTATEVPDAMAHRLRRLNQFLLDRTGGQKYATLFYSLIHQDGRIVYVNAGHPPPLILRKHGEVVDVPANCMPVGVMEDADFSVAEVVLDPGDRLVIYSDGVTEAQDLESAFFGRKRLVAAAQSSSGNCAAICAAIQDAVSAFTGGAPQSDDLTLVVLEYRASSPEDTIF